MTEDRLAAIKRRLSATTPNAVRDAIDRELIAEVDRLRDLLARLEWAGYDGYGNLCGICEMPQDRGHRPGCDLAAALGKHEAAAPPG